MNRVLFVLGLCVPVCLAGADSKQPAKKSPQPDMSQMPADAHAPLFRPKAPDAGKVTERLTSELGKPQATGPVPHRNFIDDEIFGKMQRDSVPHAPLTSDQEFIRRVKLDLAGRIPSPGEVRDFAADTSPDKRSKLIEKLVGSPEWVDKWAYFYMDTFRANGKMARGLNLFYYTLKESLASDRPYDDWARDLISASAKSNYVVAAANPISREHVEGKPGEPADGDDLSKINQIDTHDELSILFAKIFLGINTSCISCHDGRGHLEKVNAYLATRKRSDFFQQAAFFGRTRYIVHLEHSKVQMGHTLVDDLGPGYDTKAPSMLRTPRTGGPNTPKFLLTDEAARPDVDPREELARMLTAHPQFARAAVNMFWAKLMGVGIVDPFDEFDLARLDPKKAPPGWDVQPSHPELLEKLAAYFRDNNYSVQKLFRLICNSSAYQLSARFPGQWKETYTRYYARKYARMLSAEELHDAIVSATERPGRFVIATRNEDGSSDGGASTTVGMAMQVSIPQPRGELKSFMSAFGESNRGAPAHPPVPSPLQPIMMMRSSVVNDRVLAQKDSRVQRLLDSYKDNGKVIDELFVGTLSRDPDPAEKALAMKVMDKDRVEGAQNLQWALLNLVEFLYNF
jgi:hypothetical protein